MIEIVREHEAERRIEQERQSLGYRARLPVSLEQARDYLQRHEQRRAWGPGTGGIPGTLAMGAGAIVGFSDYRLGTREFDYDFDPSRLTTHTPDAFERITANAGIVGNVQSGFPSNLEPRLVTVDGVQCAFIPNGGDDSAQRFEDETGNFAQWTPLHNGSACMIALLHKRPVSPTVTGQILYNYTNDAGIIWQIPTSGQILLLVRAFGSYLFSLSADSGSAPEDQWALYMYTCDGSGGHRLYVNDSFQKAKTSISGYNVSDSSQSMHIMNVPAGENYLEGNTARLWGYTGVNVEANGGAIRTQFYSLVKETYPTLGLP